MSDEAVVVTVADGIGTVRLNRPERRNALSAAVIRELPERVRELDRRDDVAVIVLTGTDPAFCSGVDLKDHERITDAGGRFPPLRGGRDSPMPRVATATIAAVNGAAVTGGMELALACDLVVASDRAVFADTHAVVGLVPGWGMSVRLAERVGVARAKELSLTARTVDAQEAYQLGIVNRVVPHAELGAAVTRLAEEIASRDRDVVGALLAVYDEADDALRAGAWAVEARVAEAWEGRGPRPRLRR